jgi:regulator of sirC expression with transglutaminase-like and TPR domain
MAPPLPTEAPTTLEYFAALVADDAGFPLVEAAIAVVQAERPVDIQSELAEIDRLAERLHRRLPADASAMHRLRLLNRYFFDELGFAGNVNDYYDRRNSYLPDVRRTRRGIPITLALLYIEIARQIGLAACGVGFPGHYLVKLRLPRGEVVLDPFDGHSLSRDELEERLLPFRRRLGEAADFEAPLALYLRAATPRETLARLLRNLKEIHRSAADWPRALAIADRLVILLPGDGQERRDRGYVLAELGRDGAARSDLARYLDECPNADDVAQVQRRLAALRRRRPLP